MVVFDHAEVVYVLVVSAGLIIPRYVYELWHHDEVVASGGMYAAGDAMLAIFIACLFLIPTAFLLWVTAKFEAFYNAYSRVLLAVSLSAPVCLGLIFLGEQRLVQNFHDFCWLKMLCWPFILLVLCVSQFDARVADPKIQVIGADLTGNRPLFLSNGLHRGVPLHNQTKELVVAHVERLWGHDVKLEEQAA